MIRRNFLQRMGCIAPALWAEREAPVREVTVQRNADGSYSVWHKDLPGTNIVVTNFAGVGSAIAHAQRFLVEDQA